MSKESEAAEAAALKADQKAARKADAAFKDGVPLKAGDPIPATRFAPMAMVVNTAGGKRDATKLTVAPLPGPLCAGDTVMFLDREIRIKSDAPVGSTSLDISILTADLPAGDSTVVNTRQTRHASSIVIAVIGNRVIAETPNANNSKEVDLTVRGVDPSSIRVGDRIFLGHTATASTVPLTVTDLSGSGSTPVVLNTQGNPVQQDAAAFAAEKRSITDQGEFRPAPDRPLSAAEKQVVADERQAEADFQHEGDILSAAPRIKGRK